MTVLSNIITPSNVLTTTNTATVTNKTLTSPTVAGMTVSDGTANGVTYLNGSKVLTSGSALTFDGSKVEVSNGTFRASNTSGWHTNLTATGLTNSGTTMDFDSVSSYLFKIATAEQMRLTTTGLGIGTSSPLQKLHVSADTSGALFQGTTLGGITFLKTGNTGMQLFSDATGTLKIYDNNAGTVLTMLNGNLGLGATSITPRDSGARTLELYGTSSGRTAIKFTNATSGTGATDGMFLGYDDNLNFSIVNNESGVITFSTNNTERARIDSSGNLLVGTTTKNNMNGTLLQTLGSSGIVNSSSASVAQNGTLVVTAAGSGSSFTGFLSVSNVLVSNANIRTQTLYAVIGRGTTFTATQLATANGSTGGASFTVTCPSTGAITVTNTYAGATQVDMTYIGHSGG